MSAWKSVKSANEILLNGITVEIEKHDGSMNSIVLRDASGQSLRIAHESYSMKAYVPEPPKKEKRFVVEGIAAGLPVREEFDNLHAASNRIADLEEKIVADMSLRTAEVEVEIPF